MEHELRIAVVDDMEQDRIQIMEETDAILSRAKIAHSIDCYADAEALLDAIQGGRKYHLLLLDVLMDQMDGMALAAERGRSCRYHFYFHQSGDGPPGL